MSRLFRRVLVAFATGETAASYTLQILNAAGEVVQTVTGLPGIPMADAVVMDVTVPASLEAAITRLRWQKLMVSGGTWADARDEEGELIETPKAGSTKTAQDCKGDTVIVSLEMFASAFVRLLPVNSSGTLTAPGAVTFEIGLKD